MIATMQMRVREREAVTAGGRDHTVEATLIGTAVARFSRAGQRPDGPAVGIMPLGPQRHQARQSPDIGASAGAPALPVASFRVREHGACRICPVTVLKPARWLSRRV